MNPWLLYFLDGTTFFAGLLITATSLGLRLIVSKRWLVRLLNLATILGVILVVLSAMPLPIWAYAIWCGLVLVLLFLPIHQMKQNNNESAEQKGQGKNLLPLCFYLACVIATLGLFLMELPYHRAPSIVVDEDATVYIVGDSLSTGIGDEKEETWPTLYAQKSGYKVVNLAVPGATTKTAMQQVASIPDDESTVVLVEIGGNDLLGGKKSDFYTDLERLLSVLAKKKSRVVLFELPLPPFYNRYGQAQRELARKYHVAMIPKRYLAQTLCTADGTVDGLHLSKTGHQALADMVHQMQRPKQKH